MNAAFSILPSNILQKNQNLHVWGFIPAWSNIWCQFHLIRRTWEVQLERYSRRSFLNFTLMFNVLCFDPSSNVKLLPSASASQIKQRSEMIRGYKKFLLHSQTLMRRLLFPPSFSFLTLWSSLTSRRRSPSETRRVCASKQKPVSDEQLDFHTLTWSFPLFFTLQPQTLKDFTAISW